ncbi:hypothetical protein SELMODRAFT_432608 [Selaginella moellendorffii]|uniref:inositol-1,3,4-trisphosphate 5/6-kinase n=1 Tax=Selaginella moellendorffii TaxID=88036 RepID=D8TGI9_SELML|nr:hypothetical protein SELMODRAFT_432608 [Selaginella moellendorffii]
MSSPKFPVIAKLLVANGSTNSHAMSLTFNQEGLTKFKLPVVLQEFFNHGGVIFKMYVVGNYVKCVKRRSLPDVPEDELNRLEALCFLQICGASDCLPPTKFVAELAKGLRAPDLQLQSHLGLICVTSMELLVDRICGRNRQPWPKVPTRLMRILFTSGSW